jgi:hypothetical protein
MSAQIEEKRGSKKNGKNSSRRPIERETKEVDE